ncbi:PREDICTED: centromere protein W [Tinamus guttatus]|uniref:centromere protein W n=1 Tax=Tinamus guttatus TaxID=94827 RepID=UPI00052E7DE2|nr:PREDICTED: centromere protein W [Tinamus guttatus]
MTLCIPWVTVVFRKQALHVSLSSFDYRFVVLTGVLAQLRKKIKKHKPRLRLAANIDLLVHLNFLLFLHRLAEEARTNAFENKSKIIKPEHTVAAAKVVLKKSRG